MPTERVYSKNATYQMFETLKTNRNKRYRRKAFFVEGVRNINAAIHYGWPIISFMYPGGAPLSDWASGLLSSVQTEVNYQLAPQLMAEMSDKTDASELLAIVAMREDSPGALMLPDIPLLALFDRPSNRGNLGTLLRSCDALGVDALLLTGHGVDPYDADVVVSSMGSFFKVPMIRLANNDETDAYLASLRSRHPGFQVIGTTAHRERTLYEVDFTRPTLLMIGNETEGLNRRYKEACDLLVTIPMAEACEATSLNVACAASILFAEASRQRMRA